MSLTYEQRVLRVLQYIHENPSGDLSLDILADIGLMSRFHWHRVFHAIAGETCAQAVRRIRLYRASTWLINADFPVAEIAMQVGYPNVHSFTRAFKDRFGVSPAAYRKEGRHGLPYTLPSRGNLIMFKVEIENAPEYRLGALLHQGPYTAISKVFENLVNIASAEQLWPRTRGMVGVHYDDPNVVSEDRLKSHAGLVMADDRPLPEALQEVMLPANRCAVLHYKGPYTAIKVAYDYLYGDWLPKSGYEPADSPPYEVYLNSPFDTEESDLLTDIMLPLAE